MNKFFSSVLFSKKEFVAVEKIQNFGKVNIFYRTQNNETLSQLGNI